MHRRLMLTMLTGCALIGAAACAGAESRSGDTASARRSTLGTSVAAEAPLPGFGADVPAGAIPGSATVPARGSIASTGGADSTARTRGQPTSGAPLNDTGRTSASAATPAASTPPSASATPSTGRTLADDEISAATGVFTVAQADRGREVYTNSCARCHMASQHSGGTFASTWDTRRVFDLYDLLSSTMPLDDPGSLSAQAYVDVVAYMLQLNGHPAGARALAPDPATLRRLRIDIRPGTAP